MKSLLRNWFSSGWRRVHSTPSDRHNEAKVESIPLRNFESRGGCDSVLWKPGGAIKPALHAHRHGPGHLVPIEAVALLERTEWLQGRRAARHIDRAARAAHSVAPCSQSAFTSATTRTPFVLVSDVRLRPQELAVPGLQESHADPRRYSIGHEALHERNDRQHLARVTEEERKQNGCPSTNRGASPIAIDPPRPPLRVEQEASSRSLRDGPNHIGNHWLYKLRITRDNSFRRCCFATSPLFHIRGGIVRQIPRRRGVSSPPSAPPSASARHSQPDDVPLVVPMIGDAPLRRYLTGRERADRPHDGLHMHTHWRLLRSPHRVTSTCLGSFHSSAETAKNQRPHRLLQMPPEAPPTADIARHHRRSSPGGRSRTCQQLVAHILI